MGFELTQNTEHTVISVEGLIGCGKSTFCRWVRRNTDMLVADESESPLLTAFYENPKRWAFATQIDLLTQRTAMLKTANKVKHKRSVVLDRSVVGDRAFARTQWKLGYLDPHEYRLYDDVFHTLLEDIEAPECILWLNVSVETALKRIQKRGRAESVDLEYLTQLAESYDRTLEDLEGRGVRVIRADWNKDLSDAEYSYHADRLLTQLLRAHVDA